MSIKKKLKKKYKMFGGLFGKLLIGAVGTLLLSAVFDKDNGENNKVKDDIVAFDEINKEDNNIKDVFKKRDSKKMSDTQITALGMTGAGKTCFLLSLYKKMKDTFKGFSIITDDDNDVHLTERYKKLGDINLGIDRFPMPTMDLEEFSFELRYGTTKIMSFDWIDYPGGHLETKKEGNIEQYKKIKETIKKSSSLFIFLDGALITGKDEEEDVEKVQDKCSGEINRLYQDYVTTNKLFPPTNIVVTKSDLLKNVEGEYIYSVIEEAFSPLFVKDKVKKLISIMPVSIASNVDDNFKLKPKYIHYPIFFGIFFAIRAKIDELEKKIYSLEKVDKANKNEIFYLERSKEEEKSK